MTRKVETIKLQGNVHYAKVSQRLLAFLEDNPTASIETTVTASGNGAVFRAVVSCERGTFTGHSYATAKHLDKLKQFEKQETIAVGRALAFAGYLASGEIASLEEMQEYELRREDSPHGGITEHELNNLKRDFALANKTTPKAELAAKFAGWVRDVIDDQDFDPTDWRLWSRGTLNACHYALTPEGK